MAGTRLGVVEDALVVLFNTISGANAIDGPGPETFSELDGIEVGIGVTSVSNQHARGLAVSYLESLTIPCRAWSWAGDDQLKPRRDRAIELLEEVRTMLAADVTLGGVCDEAWLGPSWSGLPINDSKGVSYQISFSVQVKSSI